MNRAHTVMCVFLVWLIRLCVCVYVRDRERETVWKSLRAPQAYWWNAYLGGGQESFLQDREKKETRKCWK